MPFVKPSLHHRRSITASSSPIAPAITDTLPPKTPSSPLQPSPPEAVYSATSSEPTLPTLFSFPPPPPLSRRRSNPADGESEGARKRRRRHPRKPEDITKDTPILYAPSSSELSRSHGWETSSSSSSSRHTEAEVEIMEPIEMERKLVSDEQAQEVHAAADALVEQGDITKNQGDVLKDIFDNSYDQPQLYNYLLGCLAEEDYEVKIKPDIAELLNETVKEEETKEHIIKIKLEALEENGLEGIPEASDEEEPAEGTPEDGGKKSKSSSPEPAKSIEGYKAKSILLDVRNGVGKFALRLREGRDKKTDPTRDSHPRRSRTYRSLLLRRDANRCVITHIRDPLIAAHILPFTIASLDGMHSFWSLLRLMLGPTIAGQLFERYGFKSKRRRGNTGINAPENGWMLRSDLDEYFSRMQCYLEPMPEDPNKYVFHWLDEPADLPMSSKTHVDEKRQQRPVETGNVIDLTPLAVPEEGTMSKPALSVPPPPSRALITMQAAIHKLAHRFRGQADVFAPVHGPDSETLSSLEDDFEEEQEDDYEEDEGHQQRPDERDTIVHNSTNHMYLLRKSVGEWLSGVTSLHGEPPENPESLKQLLESPTLITSNEERPTAPRNNGDDNSDNSSNDGPEPHIPRFWAAVKRTKMSHNQSPTSAEHSLFAQGRGAKAKMLPELGLISPAFTTESEPVVDEWDHAQRKIMEALRESARLPGLQRGVKRGADDSQAPVERKRKRLG
ncbi:hypothetical protein Dda_1592 [Drechslerella dactyloides]|uniref:HNH nuclease domain-containing protein n=1 Tax=Drechslerella dactyloides TaxID=74499 RepID=A0AAD6NN82_DREDA|nr:hypothetical protein Dda_1592 [Drechslerella dactyloides]